MKPSSGTMLSTDQKRPSRISCGTSGHLTVRIPSLPRRRLPRAWHAWINHKVKRHYSVLHPEQAVLVEGGRSGQPNGKPVGGRGKGRTKSDRGTKSRKTVRGA
jgi:hypothetical protein